MKRLLSILAFVFCSSVLIGQNANSFTASGFLEYSNTTWAPSGRGIWSEQSGFYTRLNLQWQPGNSFSLHAGIRNNFNFGSLMAQFYPFYHNMLSNDAGWMDLTFTLNEDTSYILLSNTDRLFAKWTLDKLEITLGRQRINWGMNMVWNPNDIFNTYNYFDFDYVERPGSDALLLQYFTGDLSSVQLAFKLNRDKELTAALLYKFNLANYDFQLMGGIMNKDFVAGLGWSGQVGGAGFTGETSYFRNTDHFSNSTGQWVTSVGLNYTLNCGLFINTSFLYNSKGTTGNAGRTNFLFMGNLSPKTLTLSRINVFTEVSYPVTPLIKADLSTIFNPNDHSAFMGPSLDLSLTDNLQLFIMAQLFLGSETSEYGNYGKMIYLKLKGSF